MSSGINTGGKGRGGGRGGEGEGEEKGKRKGGEESYCKQPEVTCKDGSLFS